MQERFGRLILYLMCLSLGQLPPGAPGGNRKPGRRRKLTKAERAELEAWGEQQTKAQLEAARLRLRRRVRKADAQRRQEGRDPVTAEECQAWAEEEMDETDRRLRELFGIEEPSDG